MTEFFAVRHGILHAEGVPLPEVARAVGTPTYVYSLAALQRGYRAFAQGLEGTSHLICYSVKANGNLAILRAFAREGSGFDIVSAGELLRVLAAGGDAGKVVFSGVGKTDADITAALRAGILMLNVESAAELEAVDRLARRLGVIAPISLRVNPDVDPRTHPYVSTGLRESKFGVPVTEAVSLYRRARELPGVRVIGLDCHIGSQLTSVGPFVDSARQLRTLVTEHLSQLDPPLRYLDIGGGLGITYEDERPPTPAEYAAAVRDALGDLRLTLIIEPGRSLVGNAGVLLTRVLYQKETPDKHFTVVDAGMNDLIRPTLYGAYQRIDAVTEQERPTRIVDVVGPVCESGDFLAKERALPAVAPGDLLAVRGAGAYGFVMASNYNARPLPAEVLVDGGNFHVVRDRQPLEQLMRGERIPGPLR